MTDLTETSEAVEAAATAQPLQLIGWGLALIVPVAVYFGLIALEQPENVAIFAAIVSLPIVMWPFALLPDFVPGLLAVVLVMLVGAAPAEVVLSGFASSGFLMIIAILGLGALIRTSGLVNRLAVGMVQILPRKTGAYAGAIFFGGLLLTPFLPSPAGRLAVTGPLIRQLNTKLGARLNNKGRTLIFQAGLDGVVLLTAAFLTAAPVNLIIFSLLPQQERVAFQFVDWIIASAVAAGVMVLGYVILLLVFCFTAQSLPEEEGSGAEEAVPEIPERLTRREWGAIIGILSLGVGVLTTPLHLIPTPVLAFLIFALLFAFEIMEQPDFVAEIDWAFIFLLGALVGLTQTMSHLGITAELVAQTEWLGAILRDDFQSFVLIVAAVIVLVRLVVPQTATTLVMVAALLPLAEAVGVTAWVVGFTILMMTDAVILDYQSPMHRVYRQGTRVGVGLDSWRITAVRVGMIGVRVAAVLISIPYWRSLGVL